MEARKERWDHPWMKYLSTIILAALLLTTTVSLCVFIVKSEINEARYEIIQSEYTRLLETSNSYSEAKINKLQENLDTYQSTMQRKIYILEEKLEEYRRESKNIRSETKKSP